MVEDTLICLLQEVVLQVFGKVGNELVLLFVVEVLLEVDGLLNEVGDLPVKFAGDRGVLCNLPEQFDVALLLVVLGLDVEDKVSHAVDVVGQHDAAEGLDEDQANGLFVVASCNIAEADCEHDVGAPVVSPDVLFEPVSPVNVPDGHPVLVGADLGHGREDDGQNVGETEVEEEDFDQGPVLVFLVVGNQFDFHFL